QKSCVEVNVSSHGQLNELVECKKSVYKFLISEPVHVGGQNCAPTPLEFLLSGATGCYAAVFAFYAAELGVAYDAFEAVARTEFDARGHMMADAPPSAFRKVMISVQVKSDAPTEKLKEVERLALAGRPGISTLRAPGLGVTPPGAEKAAGGGRRNGSRIPPLRLRGRPFRLVRANSRSCRSLMLSTISRDAPLRLCFERSPRLAASAAPAAICCFFDLAGMASSCG